MSQEVTIDERVTREERTTQTIAEMIDRWCYIHRHDVRDPELTDTQKYRKLKRRVIAKLKESL